ncbi:hypothetical protein BH11MYX1_BH11MYX1_32970 [soil metagenome]
MMTKLVILTSLLRSAVLSTMLGALLAGCVDTQSPAATSTTATPPPPVPSPAPGSGPVGRVPPGCVAQGTVLFQSETRATQAGAQLDVPLRTTIVYESGGFTYAEMIKGKPTATVTGCLPDSQLAKLRDDLKSSEWQISAPTGLRCMAQSITYEEYASHGKVLWDAVVCGDKILDAKSQRNLTEIVTLLGELTAPHDPPCCKN